MLSKNGGQSFYGRWDPSLIDAAPESFRRSWSTQPGFPIYSVLAPLHPLLTIGHGDFFALRLSKTTSLPGLPHSSDSFAAELTSADTSRACNSSAGENEKPAKLRLGEISRLSVPRYPIGLPLNAACEDSRSASESSSRGQAE
jgi:hypothetical protein